MRISVRQLKQIIKETIQEMDNSSSEEEELKNAINKLDPNQALELKNKLLLLKNKEKEINEGIKPSTALKAGVAASMFGTGIGAIIDKLNDLGLGGHQDISQLAKAIIAGGLATIVTKALTDKLNKEKYPTILRKDELQEISKKILKKILKEEIKNIIRKNEQPAVDLENEQPAVSLPKLEDSIKDFVNKHPDKIKAFLNNIKRVNESGHGGGMAGLMAGSVAALPIYGAVATALDNGNLGAAAAAVGSAGIGVLVASLVKKHATKKLRIEVAKKIVASDSLDMLKPEILGSLENTTYIPFNEREEAEKEIIENLKKLNFTYDELHSFIEHPNASPLTRGYSRPSERRDY